MEQGYEKYGAGVLKNRRGIEKTVGVLKYGAGGGFFPIAWGVFIAWGKRENAQKITKNTQKF